MLNSAAPSPTITTSRISETDEEAIRLKEVGELEGGSAPTQDEKEQQRTQDGNDDGANASEAAGEKSEHQG